MSNSLDISAIIASAKKDFTRAKSSAIKDFLVANPSAVVISHINKTRGASIKINTMQGGEYKTYEYITANAQIVLQALQHNGVNIYKYERKTGDIIPVQE